MKKCLLLLSLLAVSGCVVTPGQHTVGANGLPTKSYQFVQDYFAAPTVLQTTVPEMKTPGYWISRHADPDKVVLTSEQVAKFNAEVVKEDRLRDDISVFSETYTGSKVKDSLTRQLAGLRASGFFADSGEKADVAFFGRLEQQLDISSIPTTVTVRFGFVTQNADQRLMPTDEGLFEKRGDIDFDELQNSALDVGAPIAILHQSKDGAWLYAVSPSSSGWVKADRVGLCARSEIVSLLAKQTSVVVIAAKADIFRDSAMRKYSGFARMGSAFFVMSGKVGDAYEVYLPTRITDGTLALVSGYIPAEQVHEGFLPYTPRVVLNQAFKLLNTPYGWGGANGEQDCSQFLQEVFATVGLQLPRNSSQQAKVGKGLADFTPETLPESKLKTLLTKGSGATTLLYMKGHILLYLGLENGTPYAIHDVWAFRENIAGKDVPKLINRVAVSELTLGKGSKKGSLVERLKAIRLVE